eukprot:TRINITY_DN1487_c0_g1_i1.p1 TRINITY_DN1487_c0_g1~~TRINITY_DN1487_c0_g1_i1.p1  ORF type:complete len:364 (-),score=54.50 TRINITY_DN1487_c0_g1_i1:88-1179(-)
MELLSPPQEEFLVLLHKMAIGPCSLLLFVLSVLCTAGVENVAVEAQSWVKSRFTTLLQFDCGKKLLSCTPELLHLLLYGRAYTAIVEGGTDIGGDLASCYYPPPLAREIGIVSEHCRVLLPQLPVWVLCGTTMEDRCHSVLFGDACFAVSPMTVDLAPVLCHACGPRLSRMRVFRDDRWTSPVPSAPLAGVLLGLQSAGVAEHTTFEFAVALPDNRDIWGCVCGAKIVDAEIPCPTCASWRCWCTMVNSKDEDRCQTCDMPRAPLSLVAHALDGMEQWQNAAVRYVEWDGPWVCALCSHHNEDTLRETCAACESRRSRKAYLTYDQLDEAARREAEKLLPGVLSCLHRIWPNASVFTVDNPGS